MTDAKQILVLLDDAAAGATLLALSSALAQALKRDLGLVFVENSRSLAAAALPFTQVLPHSGAGWVPLSTDDVEQGFRAHAARLRGLAARIALQHRVDWSLRVVRGNLDALAASLHGESDLLLLAGLRNIESPRAPPNRRTVVAVARAGDALALRAQDVASALAGALDGVLETRQGPGPLGPQPDVLVLPRLLLSPRLLAERRCPLLLVG
jgi:hypothetical protein